MSTSRVCPCVRKTVYRLLITRFSTQILLCNSNSLTESSLLSSPLGKLGPRFRHPQLAESFLSFSQLGCHEIAPATPCVRDAHSPRVGLQFRRDRFPRIVALQQSFLHWASLSPSIFQMQIWMALWSPRVYDASQKCYCRISKNYKRGRLVLRTVKTNLGLCNSIAQATRES